MVNIGPNLPLPRLLVGYCAPDLRQRSNLWWALDERLGAILQQGREPAIMAIRLAWWRDALVRGDQNKGKGEPLIEALRMAGLSDFERQYIDQLIEGWAQIAGADHLDRAELMAYAAARGGGLFALLADDGASGIMAAGSVWALWDFAAHLSDKSLATLCLQTAQTILPQTQLGNGAHVRPLRLALAVSRPDVLSGRVPNGGFEFRHYWRLLCASVSIGVR